METETMGRVLVEATIINLQDMWDADRNQLPKDRIRQITVSDALVDTGATTLALPTRLIQQLGLRKQFERSAKSSVGTSVVNMYDVVRLRVMGRECGVEVMEVPDDVPVLIGQVPLEILDLVVDPQGRRLTGNPAHNGEHVLELY